MPKTYNGKYGTVEAGLGAVFTGEYKLRSERRTERVIGALRQIFDSPDTPGRSSWHVGRRAFGFLPRQVSRVWQSHGDAVTATRGLFSKETSVVVGENSQRHGVAMAIYDLTRLPSWAEPWRVELTLPGISANQVGPKGARRNAALAAIEAVEGGVRVSNSGFEDALDVAASGPEGDRVIKTIAGVGYTALAEGFDAVREKGLDLRGKWNYSPAARAREVFTHLMQQPSPAPVG